MIDHVYAAVLLVGLIVTVPVWGPPWLSLCRGVWRGR